eukprot:789167-Amphidinium_carterae.1
MNNFGDLKILLPLAVMLQWCMNSAEAQNPLIPECFKYVEEGTELSETATDIIIELLRMSASELNAFEPVIKVSTL